MRENLYLKENDIAEEFFNFVIKFRRDKMKPIKKITVIGSGIMGSGIAGSIFKYGFDVTLFDTVTEKLDAAVSGIKARARRKMNPDNIRAVYSLKDAVKNADLVIEAIFEDLDIKCRFFKELGETAPEEVIFASNTSSLPISVMAEASGRADRFIGLHFFNPAIIMRLVEIIIPKKLNNQVLGQVEEFIQNIKKTGVKCKESPGFVVNRILLPIVNEAFYILEDRIASSDKKALEIINDIDSAIVRDMVLLMGPFDLVDLTGLDVIYHVANVIYKGFNKNPRYKPAGILQEYVDKKFLGRKTKKGFYNYGNKENDPDLNPCLDDSGNQVKRIENPDFETIYLVAAIVNEAFRIIEEGIVKDFNDIELSMELGARWPKGPFRLAKVNGVEKIQSILKKRYRETNNNPRYEPSGLFNNLTPELAEFFAEGK